MKDLLRRYIREILLEIDVNPAVANQLPGTPKPGEKSKKNKEDEVEEMEEMSTVGGSLGAGGGFTAPLGFTSKDVECPGAKGQRRKRKKPTWR